MVCHGSREWQVSLPIDLRRVVGLERGGSITLEFDDEVKILTVAARVRRARALAKKALAGKSISVDDFLSYKR